MRMTIIIILITVIIKYTESDCLIWLNVVVVDLLLQVFLCSDCLKHIVMFNSLLTTYYIINVWFFFFQKCIFVLLDWKYIIAWVYCSIWLFSWWKYIVEMFGCFIRYIVLPLYTVTNLFGKLMRLHSLNLIFSQDQEIVFVGLSFAKETVNRIYKPTGKHSSPGQSCREIKRANPGIKNGNKITSFQFFPPIFFFKDQNKVCVSFFVCLL